MSELNEKTICWLCGGKLIIGRQYLDLYQEKPIIKLSTVCEKCGDDRPYQPPKRDSKGRFIKYSGLPHRKSDSPEGGEGND